MRWADCLHHIEEWLVQSRHFWHPQPFRESRPDWCAVWPALAAEVLALNDEEVERLNRDGEAALRLLARHCPDVARPVFSPGYCEKSAQNTTRASAAWAWGIPGRKCAQIEAFVAACAATGQPLLEWCAGKGHLGRLFAIEHGVAVRSLEINPALCGEGDGLARRVGVAQEFLRADALSATVPLGVHAVALHACGELHRALLRQANQCNALDIAPCCYHLGVDTVYEPLSTQAGLRLTRDDVRLAVTETVTASARQAGRRDQEMAWKLAFDGWRRQKSGAAYTSFKPVPPEWMRQGFPAFCRKLAEREGVALPDVADCSGLEEAGWRRQREVMRLSVVRHAFRRPLELWLALDMAVFLEEQGWGVKLSAFCPREWTPRNLLISARH